MKARCLISDSNDPYFNLATEDWIFHDLNPEQHILFLWRNEECVILGRNQNPWTECDVQKLKENNVNLVRRHSGGGTVYQDLGNSIFTFLSSKEKYDKKRNFSIIINALQKFDIKAEQIGRNDIDRKRVMRCRENTANYRSPDFRRMTMFYPHLWQNIEPALEQYDKIEEC